jgi:hypothetical protein
VFVCLAELVVSFALGVGAYLRLCVQSEKGRDDVGLSWVSVSEGRGKYVRWRSRAIVFG